MENNGEPRKLPNHLPLFCHKLEKLEGKTFKLKKGIKEPEF